MILKRTVLSGSIALALFLSTNTYSNSCGGGGDDFSVGLSSHSTSLSTDFGGVSLNKTAQLLLQLEDIEGAVFDQGTGQIVFYGKERLELPEMDLDDLTVAIRSIFGHGGKAPQNPGVSIGTEPSAIAGKMLVRYDGQTRDTRFGQVMFDADRLLKILTIGQDNETRQAVTSQVPGYRSLLDRILDDIASGQRLVNSREKSRLWFVPDEVVLKKNSAGDAMVFEKVAMKVLSESKLLTETGQVQTGGVLDSIAPVIQQDGTIIEDKASEGFAKHFTENYDAFANEFPILKELKRLGKITAVIKWIRDNDVPFDLSFVKSYVPKYVATPTHTPEITVKKSRGNITLTVVGGVSFRLADENYTEKQDAQTSVLRNDLLAARPNETDFSWEINSGGEQYKAVAQSFARTKKDGNVSWRVTDMQLPVRGELKLELSRYYNSFNEKSSVLGRGWRITPFQLRLADSLRYYIVTKSNGQKITVPSYYRVFVSKGKSEQAYVFSGIREDDVPVFYSKNAQDILVYLHETKSFELQSLDKSVISFDDKGRLSKVTDRYQQSLAYQYNSADEDAQLTHISHSNGRSIDLSYANERLAEVTGSGGLSVQYQYGPQKELLQVTKNGQIIQYQYDNELRLTQVTDAKGQAIFSANYDDYNRAGDQQYASNARLSRQFDLSARKSVSKNAKDLETTKYYDSDFRLLTSIDSAGRQVDLSWKTAFGPSSITDPKGAKTTIDYDGLGNVTKIVDAKGQSRQLYYNKNNKVYLSQNTKNFGQYKAYDSNNRLTTKYSSVAINNGRLSFDGRYKTEYSYDEFGNLTTVKTGSGTNSRQASVKYDDNSLPIEITGADGKKVYRQYDERSRLISIRDGYSELVRYTYNDANQVTLSKTLKGSTRYSYDENGNLSSKTNARGYATHYQYNADNRLSQVTDPEGGITSYRYDIHGKLVSVTLPNGVERSIHYDNLDRPVSQALTLSARKNTTALQVANAEVK